MSAEGPYANPQPYPDVGVERDAIKGRLKVAQTIIDAVKDPQTARQRIRLASWTETRDRLLDHLNEIDARVESAVIEQAYSKDDQ